MKFGRYFSITTISLTVGCSGTHAIKPMSWPSCVAEAGVASSPWCPRPVSITSGWAAAGVVTPDGELPVPAQTLQS